MRSDPASGDLRLLAVRAAQQDCMQMIISVGLNLARLSTRTETVLFLRVLLNMPNRQVGHQRYGSSHESRCVLVQIHRPAAEEQLMIPIPYLLRPSRGMTFNRYDGGVTAGCLNPSRMEINRLPVTSTNITRRQNATHLQTNKPWYSHTRDVSLDAASEATGDHVPFAKPHGPGISSNQEYNDIV